MRLFSSRFSSRHSRQGGRASPPPRGHWEGGAVTAFEITDFVNPNSDAGSTSEIQASVSASVSYDAAAEAQIEYMFREDYTWVGGGTSHPMGITVAGSVRGNRTWGTAAGSATSSASVPPLTGTTGLLNGYSAPAAQAVIISDSSPTVSTTLYADAVTTSGNSGFSATATASWYP